MVRNLHTLILLLVVSPALCQVHSVTSLWSSWKFATGSHPGAANPDFDETGWQAVTLPHDWAIAGPSIPDGDGNTGKLPWKGEGWYRPTFDQALIIVEGTGTGKARITVSGHGLAKTTTEITFQ
jgi:beta-galactosidase